MSKKNSNVILKNGFKDFEELSYTYQDFKKKLNKFKNKKILIAVSGGPDSLGLVALTKAYNFEKKIKFNYILIDHNLRKGSSKEANYVKALLTKYSINLKVIKNKRKIKKNVQSQARKVRYKLLTEYCLLKKIKLIITAHTLEDQVETFFIRLSRGSGLTGLSSMHEISEINNKIKLFRPLLDIRKKILIKISKRIFGTYIKDPSNKNSKYLRTKIRSLKKPLINSGINYDQIIRSIKNLASSKETIDVYYKGIFKKVIKKSKKDVSIELKKFYNLNQDIKFRFINDCIKYISKNYYSPRSKKVINLINTLENGKFYKSTLGKCIIYKNRDYLVFKKEKSNN